MRRSLILMVTVVLVVGLALPAGARATNGPLSRSVNEQPMYLVGFDSEVAGDNGYTVVEFADGSVSSVSSDLAASVKSPADAARLGAPVLLSPESVGTSRVAKSNGFAVVESNPEVVAGTSGISWMYLDGFTGLPGSNGIHDLQQLGPGPLVQLVHLGRRPRVAQ